MDEDPARGVRAKRDATVRVAARLVRDGEADALVSVGSTGATLAAARVHPRPAARRDPPGARRRHPRRTPARSSSSTPAPPPRRRPSCSRQFALAGAAFAPVRLGLAEPARRPADHRRGGRQGRRAAQGGVRRCWPPCRCDFVGNVEGGDVPHGGRADVVVTDGFTGNVLLKGLEGAAAMLTEVVPPRYRDARARRPPRRCCPRSPRRRDRMRPSGSAAPSCSASTGVVVVGHGASSPRAVASCVARRRAGRPRGAGRRASPPRWPTC